MTGRRFRPGLWMTLAMLPTLAVLLGLGTWQMQRLAWKTELIARIEARTADAPVPLPPTVDDPAGWDYRPVTVSGRFLHDRELHLGPRSAKGADGLTVVGVHVLTPLMRDAGPPVLVDRGFVPEASRNPATRAAGQVEGQVTVTGIARVPGQKAWAQPDNQPAENRWFWPDLPAMARTAGLEAVAPLIVQAGPDPNPGGLPVGGRTVVDLRNDHLGYALTWYGLALTLVGVYIAASFRPPARSRP